MNNYKIFLRNASGELVETEQIEAITEAITIQDAIFQVNGNYDDIVRVEDAE